ncbi:hypothetical protein EMIHUDRAFT_209080 [Emiliania huxleyi CCMP1516]|uniref:Uncharacterized protein n=2 Tax=Emiliania huxleyi TaxID=2903 RepID=A0A0D3J7M7_EMIH1|nr:hypothetical protein EMIHUDRAFT_209080 [Emiliania huxleyi CCMP1516]EOD19512.1 hypothetical protein EMIHUDRAFT_209080 [Emiliania huxleyi CCMP1516]|eukprot:XP_005771941.1 hypothetical protein EMIHUDRAFT_209080 [Emiliania huxleyi CCMP1516]
MSAGEEVETFAFQAEINQLMNPPEMITNLGTIAQSGTKGGIQHCQPASSSSSRGLDLILEYGAHYFRDPGGEGLFYSVGPPSKPGDYRFAREKNCDLRLLDFETFGGFGDGVRRILRQAADQLSNKLSHAQHLDEVTWTTKNWHGLQMQRLSVVLHTAVAWQTVNELACGDSGIVHGAECIAVLNGVA